MTSRGKLLVQKALEEITKYNISPGTYTVNEDGTLSPTPTENRPNTNHEMPSNSENNDPTDLPMVFEFQEQTDIDLLSTEFKTTDLSFNNLSTGETGIINEVEELHINEQGKIEQHNQINQIEGFGSVIADQEKSHVESDLRDELNKRVQEAAIVIDNQGTSDSESCVIDSETETINNVNNTTDDLSTTDNHQINIEPEVLKRSRKKRHQVDTKTWKINEWKTSRRVGKAYKGKKKTEEGWNYNVERKERAMKARCKCKNKENSQIKCVVLTEEDRKKNFQEYWKHEWEAKKMFVRFLTKKVKTSRARDRKDMTSSRRKWSYNYYLKKDKSIVRVCKTMFLNTLSIGEWTALNWQKNEEKDLDTEDEEGIDNDLQPRENVQEPEPKKLRKSKEVEMLEAFFQSLPKVESHYCRKNTSKMYIEPEWNSKRQLYMFYVEDWCPKNNVTALSRCKFSQTFDDFNLGLFRPKKDLCDTCESYKNGNFDEVKYEAHIIRKDESRMEKEKDKKEKKHLVYTMDLQALLLSPRSTVSSLYYKKKLAVHNFTFFDLHTTNGYCFLWNETEGNLSSNEFASIISQFVLSKLPLPSDKEKIILYSDGCAYQNRSCNVSNALLHISSTKEVIIEQKYLEVGHTQMEADSIHSTIERRLQHRKINVPAEYITVCEEARKCNPYTVDYLSHDFFKCFDGHLFYKSVRPGKVVGSPCVTDVRAFQYLPDGTINYKLNFSDEWEVLPQRKDNKVTATFFENLPNLFNERLKIKKRKFDDLQDLKAVLHKDYHDFYNNIPHHLL